MAEYLMPHNNKISIEEKRKLFSIRNNMIEIGNNFGKNENCMFCKTKEDMNHIYSCKYLNKKKNEIPYERIFNGSLSEQLKILKIFEQNMKIRNEENYKNK